jgi:hypothetical protein
MALWLSALQMYHTYLLSYVDISVVYLLDATQHYRFGHLMELNLRDISTLPSSRPKSTRNVHYNSEEGDISPATLPCDLRVRYVLIHWFVCLKIPRLT